MNPLMQVTVVCEILGFNLKALRSLRDREMMARYTRNDVILAPNLREYLSLVLADRGRMFGVADVRKARAELAKAEARAERRRRKSVILSDAEAQKLCRYEAHLERGLYKALHELQRLQAARGGEYVAPPAALDVTLDAGFVSQDARDPADRSPLP